jgi:FdhE protein
MVQGDEREMKVFKEKERDFALTRLPRLKEEFPEASHLLEFLGHILEFQREVLRELSEVSLEVDLSGAKGRIRKGKHAVKIEEFLDLLRFKPFFDRLLDLTAEKGTREIGEVSRQLREKGGEGFRSLLLRFFKGEALNDVERMLAISFLQPILNRISAEVSFGQEEWLRNRCPVCGSRPSVSFLMDTEEWEGARFLRCSLCLTDWLYIRTQCAFCGNNEDDKLSYFVSPEISYIEVQVCNECGHYLKLVDLRKDGLAVPDLEDVATVSLDIWAREQGYRKIERNLLGF